MTSRPGRDNAPAGPDGVVDRVERDTDGVPRGQAVLDALLAVLDVQQQSPDEFRGVSTRSRLQRVFGGQVAAQALVAAGRTVDDDRTVHSLHSYFVRPGDPRYPIDYRVDRTRDGRSFTTRRVVALQQDTPIFTLSASFQIDEPGIDHQLEVPESVDPESLPTFPERLADGRQRSPWADMPRPVDIRYVTDPPWARPAGAARPGAHTQVWFRADGKMPDDPLLQCCLLTYVSDLFLLDSVLAIHGLDPGQRNLQMASLDHAIWFHHPVQVDDWVLYDVSSPSASGGRGLGMGHFFGADGLMVATVVQEGLVRLR